MDFYLTELISPQNIKTATDTGCGTGEQTHIDKANFIGIGSSAEMLAKSSNPKLKNWISNWLLYKNLFTTFKNSILFLAMLRFNGQTIMRNYFRI